MIRFNNGVGGITCDYCKILIAVGYEPDLQYIYRVRKEDHVKHNGCDFCDESCHMGYKLWKARQLPPTETE